MKEDELYKICELRCPACEIKVVSEIECMGEIKVGCDVLDSCPRCGFLGNFKILAILVLFLLSVQSWAECISPVNVNVTFNSDQKYCADGNGYITTDDCPSSYHTSSYYYTNLGSARCPSSVEFNSSCPSRNRCYGWGVVCNYTTRCTSQAEADSLVCVNSGKYWVDGECKTSLCDSTKWTCNTTTETTQTTVASDNITCIKGTCFGLTYCEYVTRNTTECDNECGTHTEQTNEIPMTYEGACNDDNLSDDNMCSATKCIEAQGQYSLYQMCQSRSVINGEIQLLPRMVGGGMGSCKNAGYKAENDKTNDSSSVAQDSVQIPLECYQYGINCPEPDSSYSDPEDRTPQNGCICEPFDGQKYISQIVCPDGSSSIIYSSCDEWKQPPMSSSSTPESSSAAEWPTSSGGVGEMGDWITYSQGEDIKAALAVIANNTSKLGNNQVIVQQNQDFLNQFAYQDDGTEPQLNVPDSMLSYDSTQVDTNGIVQAIFNRLDTSNRVLDTIPTSAKICPCLTFFSGNENTSFANGHIQFKQVVIDLADFNGFNLCTIISAIVVALASVVSFFIGFSIFKNVSQ